MTRHLLAAAAVALALALGFAAGRYLPDGAPAASAVAPAPQAKAERRVLYYRNPMGLPDTSPVPKKDPMGMDYIPVYEGEEPPPDEAPGTVRISPDKVQKLGVRTEPAARRTLARTLRAVGTVQVDERGLYTVAPRFEGWIERLHVNTTGAPVARGQALAEVYSPELLAAQREYLIAYRSRAAFGQASPEARGGLFELAESTVARLRNWGLSEAQIRALQQGAEPRRTVTLVAEAGGVVLEKPSVAGMRFMPGEALFRIADLSRVWLVADVFEQDLGAVRVGQKALLRVNAYPERSFEGKVTFVYPTLSEQTRTAKVRIELPNRDRLLRPQMYGTAELAVGEAKPALAVPDSAVIDSGTRRVVLVDRGEGRFEPREVRLGRRADGYAEVLQGVAEGDRVVVSANFLIDAESNLKAALGGLGTAAAPAAGQALGASGQVEAVIADEGKVTLAHGPIPALGWPAMTMAFELQDRGQLARLKPGDRVQFDLAEKAPGEYVVTRIAPAPAVAGHKH